MRCYGRTTVAEFLEDMVVYRNLEPMDRRLPRFAEIAERVGLPTSPVPRKAEPAYGQAMAKLLQAAQNLDKPRAPLRRLLFLGDTRLNDSTAFRNIKAAGGWPGWAFIASEDLSHPPNAEVEEDLFLANRWGALGEFLRFLEEQGFPLDEGTGAIIDLDKTAIGARGRNHSMIDQVRVEAVRRTVEGLLGERFDEPMFQDAYDELNQEGYHPLTADNQDYLAYMCLMISAGAYGLQELLDDLAEGRISTFHQFIEKVEGRLRDDPDPQLAPIHDAIYANVQTGDPTPFKSFRYGEYERTVARMGYLSDEASSEEFLAEEIVITQEVREAAHYLLERGALLFGLSDKPDEASVPRPEQAARGMQAIHRVETHAVGESIADQLAD
ncbi:MAG: hypothetical protein U9Q78_02540 [Chloroflexota bacterium]|nr:hypothetical protein [Chloroflexota bacterium]